MSTWILFLNDMRSPKIEYLTPVCRASSRAELEALLEREKVERYSDGHWGKTYRQGGPLEWFNPPWGFQGTETFVEVDVESRVARYRHQLETDLAGIREIGK